MIENNNGIDEKFWIWYNKKKKGSKISFIIGD